MPEKVEIIDTKIIVVGEVKGVSSEQYPKFVWTDKDGNEYKANAKNMEYFTDAIVPGNAVQLNYAEFKGRKYIYNAVAVKDKLPTTTQKDAKVEALEKTQMAKGDPRPSYDPQRKSIERQTAIKAAVELFKGAAGATAVEAIMEAQLIEYYIETGALKGKEGSTRLTEEAKKLGAKEVDDIPFRKESN